MAYPRLTFEFDPAKAAANLRKHGVSFDEAVTVFHDPLSATLPDDQHSVEESRFITIGLSSRQRLLFVVYTETTSGTGSSGPVLLPQLRVNSMKKSPELDPLAPRPHLDFSKGVRGKYIVRLKHGSNVAIIAPDLMDAFPDSESVNNALRNLKTIADRSSKRPARRSTASARKVAVAK